MCVPFFSVPSHPQKHLSLLEPSLSMCIGDWFLVVLGKPYLLIRCIYTKSHDKIKVSGPRNLPCARLMRTPPSSSHTNLHNAKITCFKKEKKSYQKLFLSPLTAQCVCPDSSSNITQELVKNADTRPSAPTYGVRAYKEPRVITVHMEAGIFIKKANSGTSPRPIISKSLGLKPRHQYFLNFSRWF